MPVLMASAARNEIRRELDRRRKAINVAKGRVVKKSSAPPRRLIPSAGTATQKLANAPKDGLAKKGSSASLPVPRVLIPTGAPGADRKIVYMDLGEAPKRRTHPQRHQEARVPFAMKAPKLTASTASIPRAPAAVTKLSATTKHETTGAETKHTKEPSSTPIKKGMTVKMRTPAGTLPTGQRLVILNHAVVVSDVEDGYVQVVYKGKSHYSPMWVALDQVKIMPPTRS